MIEDSRIATLAAPATPAGPLTTIVDFTVPGLSWHTLGDHFQDSRAFWAAVGAGVPGSYQQRDTCPHIPEG
ncbi:hypothetical protein ACWDZ8_43600 [Streptomyces sp. NPDC003233]